MATRLDSYEFKQKGRPNLYDWDSFLDGSIWQVTRGLDYLSKTKSMRSTIAVQAKRQGKKVRTSILRDGTGVEHIVFQAFEE